MPLRLISAGLALFAVIGGAILLTFDALPHVLPGLLHAPLSAAPLLLIGLAYLALQPVVKATPLEFVQGMMLAAAFILWGVDQLLPPSRMATALGDLVIVLFVVDLSAMIRARLKGFGETA